MTAYYKTNNKVLEFNITKNLDLTIFNHYLSQKENFERSKGSLKKGYLGISLRTVAEYLKISTTKVRKLIDIFIELGIIQLISKSDKKGIPSIVESVKRNGLIIKLRHIVLNNVQELPI